MFGKCLYVCGYVIHHCRNCGLWSCSGFRFTISLQNYGWLILKLFVIVHTCVINLSLMGAPVFMIASDVIFL